jgi:hypothetical protein
MVLLFAAAMAWMESATVVYLRTLVGRLEPYQARPLPIDPHLSGIELMREAATLTMLVTAGCLAGSTRTRRFGYTLIAFGVWDLLYYVFLAVMGPWPHSVWDWDILFLIPMPWWGPVLAPSLVAALMVVLGTLLSQADPTATVRPSRWSWAACGAGCVLALMVFMADALGLVLARRASAAALSGRLPTTFQWVPFLLALLLMAAPVFNLLRPAALRADRLQPVPESE